MKGEGVPSPLPISQPNNLRRIQVVDSDLIIKLT